MSKTPEASRPSGFWWSYDEQANGNLLRLALDVNFFVLVF